MEVDLMETRRTLRVHVEAGKKAIQGTFFVTNGDLLFLPKEQPR
jgi:hypothetical protein